MVWQLIVYAGSSTGRVGVPRTCFSLRRDFRDWNSPLWGNNEAGTSPSYVGSPGSKRPLGRNDTLPTAEAFNSLLHSWLSAPPLRTAAALLLSIPFPNPQLSLPSLCSLSPSRVSGSVGCPIFRMFESQIRHALWKEKCSVLVLWTVYRFLPDRKPDISGLSRLLRTARGLIHREG